MDSSTFSDRTPLYTGCMHQNADNIHDIPPQMRKFRLKPRFRQKATATSSLLFLLATLCCETTASDCGMGVWLRTCPHRTCSGPDGMGDCIAPKDWHLHEEIQCDGEKNCTAYNDAFIEVVGWVPGQSPEAWRSRNNASDCGISSTFEAHHGIPKISNDNLWITHHPNNCNNIDAYVKSITCKGGTWSTNFSRNGKNDQRAWWPFLWQTWGARYVCSGEESPREMSQCPDPFQVAELVLDSASAPRPTGGVDTSAEYCLPAGQEWQETTTVKVGMSQTIKVEHEYSNKVTGGIEMAMPEALKLFVPEFKVTLKYEHNDKWTNGEEKTTTEDYDIGNQVKVPVMDNDQ